MLGLDIPVILVEYQYIVTELHPAIVERQRRGLPEMGVLRESDSSWYMREENGGLILGPYASPALPACYVDGPPRAEFELFQEDLDRLAPHIEAAMVRVPAFAEVGIKKLQWRHRLHPGRLADHRPGLGQAHPGSMRATFGVTAAGGAGWQLAEWIVEGEPRST